MMATAIFAGATALPCSPVAVRDSSPTPTSASTWRAWTDARHAIDRYALIAWRRGLSPGAVAGHVARWATRIRRIPRVSKKKIVFMTVGDYPASFYTTPDDVKELLYDLQYQL